MPGRLIRRDCAVCALASLLVFTALPRAEAGFVVSINGTAAVIDNGVGDLDSNPGTIRYDGTVGGYEVRLTSSTVLSTSGTQITASEFQIRNLTGSGAPLVLTITGAYHQAPSFGGEMNLTNTLARNQVAGFGYFGTVSSRFSATGAGGLGADTGDLTLLNSAERGTGYGSGGATAGEYTLTQTIIIDGLRGDKKFTLSARGEVDPGVWPKEGGAALDPPPALLHNPAPPGVVLLGVGAVLVGLYQLRAARRRV